MDKNQLTEKLNRLRIELYNLETDETEKMRLKRIDADMGDDFRENEGAKLVMEQNVILFIRIRQLKYEILRVKTELSKLKG